MMNKIMTTTLLFAAGTALANAASVVTTFSSQGSTISSTENVSCSAELSGAGSVTSAVSLRTSGVYSASLYAPNLNVNVSSGTTQRPVGDGWKATFTFSNISNFSDLSAFSFDLASYTSGGGNQTVNRGANVSATLKDANNQEIATISDSGFRVQGQQSGKNVAMVSFDFSSITSWESYSLSSLSLELSVTKASEGTNVVYGYKESGSTLSSDDVSGSCFGVNQITFSSAVPEPSAFGLLAAWARSRSSRPAVAVPASKRGNSLTRRSLKVND